MKVFVLAKCSAEANNTPEVFTTREAAKQEMHDIVQHEVDVCGEAIFSWEEWYDCAEIIYSDDTYLALEIFECEVME